MRTKSFLLPIILSVLLSCQSDYVSLDYKVIPQGIITADSSSIYFLLSKKAFRQAVGAAKFPDGGQPTYLLEELTLYQFDLIQNKLLKKYDFSDLAGENVNLSTRILASDSGVLCSVYPNTEWDFYLKNAPSEPRQKEISRLSSQYNDSTFLLINDGIIISKLLLSPEVEQKSSAYNITAIMKRLDEIPLVELGLDIKSLEAKSNRELIDECIYLKNDSPLARRAIIEQVIAFLSQEEIEGILTAMDDYASGLSGLEKTEYETYSKATYEKIKALL